MTDNALPSSSHSQLLTTPSYTTDTIEITVTSFGLEQKEDVFNIHTGVLARSSSEILRDLIKPGTSHANPNAVRFDNLSSREFGFYVHWLYSSSLEEDAFATEWNIATSYVLGQEVNLAIAVVNHADFLFLQLKDPVYQNLFIQKAIAWYRDPGNVPKICTIQLLYRQNSATWPLRKLLLDVWCFRGRPKWHISGPFGAPQEFSIDLLRLVLQHRPRKPEIECPWVVKSEEYFVPVEDATSSLKDTAPNTDG